MIELTYTGTAQTVAANGNVPFNTAVRSGCNERYRSGSSAVTIVKPGRYLVMANANVASVTAGDAVTMAITLDGEALNGATMVSSPATAVYNNVSASAIIEVYPCCCSTVRLSNVGTTNATVQNQNMTIIRIGG